MTGFDGTIVVSQNPVTNWERYSRVFHVGEFSDLSMEKRAEGDAYRLRFRLYGTRDFLGDFMLRGLGRNVHLSAPNAKSAILWEGFIFELSQTNGYVTKRVSLQEMTNRVWMRYRVTGTSTTVRSTPYEDSVSQSRFGIKDFPLAGGELESSSVADQAVQQYLALHKWPMPIPMSISLGRTLLDRPYLEVVAASYLETLGWRVYNQTVNTGNLAASSVISEVITAVGQFISSSELTANGTLVTRVFDTDRRALDIIRDIARLGDAKYQRWLIRMKPDRILTYGVAAPPTQG
jgi:hypothetical protein